jgi:hypothetical protein
MQLGFWAGVLSALSAILWFVTFIMKDLIHPMPNWQDLDAYAANFDMIRLTYVYPSLVLAITYLILLACLYRVVSEEDRIWALVALLVGVIYAVMASVNYNIQAVAVRLSLSAGQTGGIEMFLPDNLNSIFNALANSYVYLAVSMVFAGFVFRAGGLERWIRLLLWLQVVTAVGQIGRSMFDLNEGVFIATSMVWVVGAPIAFVLMALWIRTPPTSAGTQGASR